MKYFQVRGIVAVLYSEGTYAVYQRNSLTRWKNFPIIRMTWLLAKDSRVEWSQRNLSSSLETDLSFTPV